jgi:hypothetical protein
VPLLHVFSSASLRCTSSRRQQQQQLMPQQSKDKRGCAPHMRNDDTPSLGGWCEERQMFPCGNVCRSNHLQKHRFRAETRCFRAETFTSEVQ